LLVRTRCKEHSKNYLPWNSQVFVKLLRREKSVDVLLQVILEILLEDHVIPVRLLHFPPKGCILLPKALIENPNLVLEGFILCSDRDEEKTGYFFRP